MMMIRRQARWLCTGIVVSCAMLHADVVVFKDGHYDEGYVTSAGERIRVRSRDGRSEYQISTSHVERIHANQWYANLEAEEKASMTVTEPVVPSEPASVASPIAMYMRMGRMQLQRQLWRLGLRADAGGLQQVAALAIAAGMLLTFVIMCVCAVFLIIDAFKRSTAWGLACLLCPPAQLVYLFTVYTGSKGRMLLGLLAPFWWALATYVALRVH
jgi:hypothetical protein